MPRPSVYEIFLDVASQVFESKEFQDIKKELEELGIPLRLTVMPVFELVIRTAALAEKPGVKHRAERRHKALKRLMDAGVSADSILSLIRQTRLQVSHLQT